MTPYLGAYQYGMRCSYARFGKKFIPLRANRVGEFISINYSIYRQSPVKNQPINHKVDNFHVLT